MSETMVRPAEAEPGILVERVGLADLNDLGLWLLPRLEREWKVDPATALFYLRGTVASNDMLFIKAGDAVGLARIEPGRMGKPASVITDFVFCARAKQGKPEMMAIYQAFYLWARGLRCPILQRLTETTDLDEPSIKKALYGSTLVKRENCYVDTEELAGGP